MKVLNSLRYFLEKYGFKVCSRLADFLGIRSKHVRLFFVYSSFFSLGFGFLVYLVLAFWMKIKDIVYSKRTSVFDLWNKKKSNNLIDFYEKNIPF